MGMSSGHFVSCKKLLLVFLLNQGLELVLWLPIYTSFFVKLYVVVVKAIAYIQYEIIQGIIIELYCNDNLAHVNPWFGVLK